jgi:hypothetical protein
LDNTVDSINISRTADFMSSVSLYEVLYSSSDLLSALFNFEFGLSKELDNYKREFVVGNKWYRSLSPYDRSIFCEEYNSGTTLKWKRSERLSEIKSACDNLYSIFYEDVLKLILERFDSRIERIFLDSIQHYLRKKEYLGFGGYLSKIVNDICNILFIVQDCYLSSWINSRSSEELVIMYWGNDHSENVTNILRSMEYEVIEEYVNDDTGKVEFEHKLEKRRDVAPYMISKKDAREMDPKYVQRLDFLFKNPVSNAEKLFYSKLTSKDFSNCYWKFKIKYDKSDPHEVSTSLSTSSSRQPSDELEFSNIDDDPVNLYENLDTEEIIRDFYDMLISDDRRNTIIRRDLFVPCFINDWPEKYAYSLNLNVKDVKFLFDRLRYTYYNALRNRSDELIQLRFEDFYDYYKSGSVIERDVHELDRAGKEILNREMARLKETLNYDSIDEITSTLQEILDKYSDYVTNIGNRELRYREPLLKYAQVIKLGTNPSSYFKGIVIMTEAEEMNDDETIKRWARATFTTS